MARLSILFQSLVPGIFRVVVLLLFGSSLVLPSTAICQSVTGSEYEVKAGFIFNFINYVSWPIGVLPDDSAQLTLCVISENPASDVLFKLDGKSVRGRKLNVVAYEGESCVSQSNILFFASQNKSLIEEILNQADGLGVLTIGEVDGFTRIGGMINFFEENNRLRFRINIDATRREGLRMSSQLLGSAQIVGQERE